jgi:hypothetical protein
VEEDYVNYKKTYILRTQMSVFTAICQTVKGQNIQHSMTFGKLLLILQMFSTTMYGAKDNFYEGLGHVFDQFPRYDMKILLGDFNAKVGKEDIFEPIIGNESSHEIGNDNGVRVVNFATSKNLVVRSTMLPHRSIHKYTWTSPDGKTHNQIDHILLDRRQHSSILDVRSFRRADCDSDHYLVVAKVRERLAVGKRTVKKMDVERFNLKQLSEKIIPDDGGSMHL